MKQTSSDGNVKKRKRLSCKQKRRRDQYGWHESDDTFNCKVKALYYNIVTL